MDNLTLARLADQIGLLHERTARAAAQQANYWLTIRNWCIGRYVAEYELQGADRAEYGGRLMPELASRLSHVSRQGPVGIALVPLLVVLSSLPLVELTPVVIPPELADLPGIAPDLLLSRLSFSHFLELIQADTPLKQVFITLLLRKIVRHLTS